MGRCSASARCFLGARFVGHRLLRAGRPDTLCTTQSVFGRFCSTQPQPMSRDKLMEEVVELRVTKSVQDTLRAEFNRLDTKLDSSSTALSNSFRQLLKDREVRNSSATRLILLLAHFHVLLAGLVSCENRGLRCGRRGPHRRGGIPNPSQPEEAVGRETSRRMRRRRDERTSVIIDGPRWRCVDGQ